MVVRVFVSGSAMASEPAQMSMRKMGVMETSTEVLLQPQEEDSALSIRADCGNQHGDVGMPKTADDGHQERDDACNEPFHRDVSLSLGYSAEWQSSPRSR
jgi:hypothetical protein